MTQAVVWPFVVLAVFLIFRSEIKDMIPRLKKFESPVAKAEFTEKTASAMEFVIGATGPTGPSGLSGAEAQSTIRADLSADAYITKVVGAPIMKPTDNSGTSLVYSSRTLAIGAWLSLQESLHNFAKRRGYGRHLKNGEEIKLIEGLHRSGHIGTELSAMSKLVVEAVNSLSANPDLEMDTIALNAFVESAKFAQRSYENDGRFPAQK